MQQRQQEYKDVLHALQVMRIIDQNTTKPQLFLAMWLVETGKFKYDTNLQTENGFTLISQSLLQMFEDDTEVYWLAKGFYGIVKQFQQDIPRMIDRTRFLLEKEDFNLYQHLVDTEVLNALPLGSWFECCFAGIINETALGK